MQTPTQEYRGTKRAREESTPASGSSQQPQTKRQRADSPEVEDITEEFLDSSRKNREGSQRTGTSSFQQEQGLQLGLEVSSPSQQSKKPKGTKDFFKQIKSQNDLLRVEVYKQFLNATPAQKERLMFVYDIQEEKMILIHFKPIVSHLKSAADYVKTRVEVLAKDIHPMDQNELHKETGEMVYATLVERATLAHELKESLKNTNTQLDFERMSSLAKDNRIKSLEHIIIELGHDPKDRKGVKALMKEKEDDLNALKKRLKLHPTEHPQTTELQKEKQADEQLDLIMQLNQKVLDLEKELEGELQDKQGESTSQAPPTTSTTATTTEPAVAPITEAAATTAAPDSSASVEELTKAIKEMELQANEIKKAKEKLAELDAKYDKSKVTVAEQGREIKALKEKIKALEKELNLESAMAEIKRILWAKIGQSITQQWKSINTIHEQMDLIGQAETEI